MNPRGFEKSEIMATSFPKDGTDDLPADQVQNDLAFERGSIEESRRSN
jgi:hypothetical protein